MRIDLSGQWRINLLTENGEQAGEINLPGILQAQGYGNPINNYTPWVSGLHDTFWYEQEEYKQAQGEEVLIPFLAQPPRHFLGKAYYEREFEINLACEEWFLRIELTRWRTKVWIDDRYVGGDCSLCTAHEIPCGKLSEGKHVLKVCVDNSMQYPYRPDGHGVSDALGATWNGMVGEIVLETASARIMRKKEFQQYAKEHPRTVEVRDCRFYIDGCPEYFRGTHFGGDYPLTGFPVSEKAWWLEKMNIIKKWGLNAIRFHSYCPPEAAFAAADDAGIYLLVECGMWNIFKEGIEMLEVLRSESRRILEQFGHHPSFAFFSPSNEPGGKWYQPLREWVKEIREYDKQLGYENRRVYTAESGWFYDVEPSKIEGTDFLYFHRSAYGPYLGGTVRNYLGWKGGDYSPSLKGAKHPVICHELGQWCAYPDFNIIDKFTGYMKPGNYMVYKEQARKRGLLALNETLTQCSGRNQLRLYKEELEANFRTPELMGFELLDLHDYLGQGTALVGLLDTFWESKGYATPEEFRAFCGETVLLTRLSSYVWKNSQRAEVPVEVCHFGKEDLQNVTIHWELIKVSKKAEASCEKEVYEQTDLDNSCENDAYAAGEIKTKIIKRGEITSLGIITLDFSRINENSHMRIKLSMGEIQNSWDIYVFTEENVQDFMQKNADKSTKTGLICKNEQKILYTKDWNKALEALRQGGNVIYSPWLSDLNYECPSLSIKNVYWNSQMGPTWGRSVGMVVDNAHPVFRHFPTEKSGGWQWEDILENARGFHLEGMEDVQPIVRPIDDWNRSLPLGLMLEAKVKKGNLFLVSADLDGNFEQRPVANSLKNAIINYVASEEFKPLIELDEAQIEKNLFPVLRMETLVKECSFDKDAKVENPQGLFAPNPNNSVRIEKAQFPVTITFALHEAVSAKGFLYLPEQRDRAHEGFLKDYRLEYRDEGNQWKTAVKGNLRNTGLSQTISFAHDITAVEWRLVVESCYGCEDKEVWKSKGDGWHKIFKPKSAVLQIAGIHLLCENEAEHSDKIFWEKEQKSATKEIEN